jgi:hypothetical protein
MSEDKEEEKRNCLAEREEREEKGEMEEAELSEMEEYKGEGRYKEMEEAKTNNTVKKEERKARRIGKQDNFSYIISMPALFRKLSLIFT